jgi:hypothetical protein
VHGQDSSASEPQTEAGTNIASANVLTACW